MNQPEVCSLADLGLLSFRGSDVIKFLQGQLSNDVTTLAPGTLLRAGLHNPQGRTLALLMLLAGEADEVLAVLPHELIAGTLSTLKRYVLRAKVAISDASGAWRIHGIAPARAEVLVPQFALPGHSYPYEAQRRLSVQPAASAPPAGAPLPRARWRALDIAAGLPQIYLPTSGQFVAQMLNLDCIGAISFQKGCYTGQEVIARAHYRGRVKRRLQRFVTDAPLRLVPGDAGHLTDGRPFRVVEALLREDQRTEFLAVAPLPGTESESEPGVGAAATHGPSPAAPVEARPLPLPYALPL